MPDIKLDTIVCKPNHIHTDKADNIIVKLDRSIHIVLRELKITINKMI